MSGFWEGLGEAELRVALGEGRAVELPPGPHEARDEPWRQEWISPGPVADRFYWSDADVCLMRGPVGSGKTTANLRKPFRRAMSMPRSTIDGVRRYKVVIARATYRNLWQTTIPSWFEVVPRGVGAWAGGRGDPVTQTIHYADEHGPVEFVAEFLAFGEGASEIQANMRGVQTTDLVIEEADTVDPILFATGIGRIDRYPAKLHFQGGPADPRPYPPELQSWGQVNMTYNAPEEANWILVLEGDAGQAREVDLALRQIIAEAGIEIAYFRQPGAFEPGAENMANLGAKYYPRQLAVMRAAGRGHDIERLVHNKIGYIRDGDPVFERHFRVRIHVAAEPLEPWPGVALRIGLDQGFFGAAVICQFRPPYQWRVLRELWFNHSMFGRDFGLALRGLIEEDPVLAGLRVEGGWGDMAGEAGNAAGAENESWNASVSEVSGIDIVPQTFGANRIEPRLNAIRGALDHLHMGAPGMEIDPGCRMLIRGFEAKYVWKDDVDHSGNRTRKPKKKGCREADVIDALGYVLMSESLPQGLTPVEDRAGPGRAGPGRRRPAEAPVKRDDWSPLMGLGGM
jgi:hypothetical protein